ncbi:SseB family protein [Microbacterium caowuchunii]|uniref:SseB family protein n=1 Tax=Microbacterium caowuchunii TaxID=2614638 RepID=A0A5N0TLQ6_9MICO|nr:SseB family protein [Microbacterium caowuchunii]KAA9134896.1 SseB family protein [Microbacterium caowuchunii]
MTDAEQTPDDLAILAARAEAGEITHIELIDAFLGATIYVPSISDPEAGPIDPVISRIDEVDYLVIASTVDALEETIDVARFAVPMDGRVLVEGMNPELAVLVNLGGGAFAIPKAMLDDLRAGTPLG